MDPLILLSNYLVGQPSRMDFLDTYEGDVLKQIHLKSIPVRLKRKGDSILEYDLTLEELFYLGYYIIVGSPTQGDYIKLKEGNALFPFQKVSHLLSTQEPFIQRAYYNDNSRRIYSVMLHDFEETIRSFVNSSIELNQLIEKMPNQQQPSQIEIHDDFLIEENYSDDEQDDQQISEELMQRIKKLQLDLDILDDRLKEENSEDEDTESDENQKLGLCNFPTQSLAAEPLIDHEFIDKSSNCELQQYNDDYQYEVSIQYASFQLPIFEQGDQLQQQQQTNQVIANQLNQIVTPPPLEIYQQRSTNFQANNQGDEPQIRLTQILLIRSAVLINIINTLQLTKRRIRGLPQIKQGKAKTKLIKQLIIKKPSKRKRRLSLILIIIKQQPKPLTPTQKEYIPTNQQYLLHCQVHYFNYYWMNQAQRNLPSNFLKILAEKPTNTDRLIIDSRRESPTIRKKLQGPQTIQANFLQRKNLLNKSASNLSQFLTSQEIISPPSKNIPTVTTLPRTLESSSGIGESIHESPEIINFSNIQTQNQDTPLYMTQKFKRQDNKTAIESNIAANGSQFPVQVFQSYMVDSRTFVKEELIDYKESILQISFNIVKYFDNKPNLHLSRRPKIVSTQHQLIALRYLITDSPISLPFDLTSVLFMEDKNQLIIVLPDISNLESIKSQLSSLYIYDLRQNSLIQSPIMEKRKFIITRINSSQQAFAITHVKPKEWISLIQYIRKQNVTELISNQNVYLYLPLQQGKLTVFSEKPSNTQLDNLYFHEDKYEWK